MSPPAHAAARHRAAPRPMEASTTWHPLGPAMLVLATTLVVVGEVATWLLLRSQGNDFGGDQAHYLIAGQALSHLSQNPLPEYSRDFATHFVYNWPSGASVTNHSFVQTFPGPHGSVFAHGIGLPLLLSPFIALGSIPFALVGLFTATAIGFVCIHQRASRLAGLSRRGQLLFVLALVGPAVWLESTQVYPDLLSGVLLACVLVEIALIERGRTVQRFSIGVTIVGLAFVPWLQIKNLAPALCCVLALAALGFRHRDRQRAFIAMAVVVVASWALLALYNQYYFGHLVGLPQPNPTFDLTSASKTLALVFDRHQGLLVQVPTVVFGLFGLWMAKRLVPLTVAATVVGSLSMLVINGTYTSDAPFGGVALAGRFEWTVLPMLMAWAPFLLVRIDLHRIRVAITALVVGLLWVAEGVPIILGDHVYINQTFAPFTPWDPTLYPGWWPAVGRLFPAFLSPSLRTTSTWFQWLFELLVLAAGALVLGNLARSGAVSFGRLVGGAAATLIVATLVVALGPTRTQPQASLSWSGTAIGSPWTGSANGFAPVPLADAGPGTYRAVLTYVVEGPAGAPSTASLVATAQGHIVVSHWLSLGHPTDAAVLDVAPAPIDLATGRAARAALVSSSSLEAQSESAVLRLTVEHQSLLSFQIRLGAGETVAATSLTLAKLTS